LTTAATTASFCLSAAAEEEEKPERCKSTQLSESEVSALSIRDKEAVVCISLAYFF
jgi:hypothetical protein